MPVKNHLAQFSMFIGVISVAFSLTGMSLPIGALGVILATLSRGTEPMHKYAKIGLALSMLGIAIGICVYIWSYFVLTSGKYDALLQQYQALYGLA